MNQVLGSDMVRTIILIALLVGIGFLLKNAAAEVDLQPSAVITNSVGMEFALVPAGLFRFGSPASEAGRLFNEGPVRQVRITRDFYMARTETTTEQFGRFAEETGYRTEAERDIDGGFGIDFATGKVIRMGGINWREPGFPGMEQSSDHPVVLISWQDAEAFCQWLSKKEGRRYRLPTEAEWEYAARGGSQTPYWSGNSPKSLKHAANVADLSFRRVMPVAEWAETWDDGYAFTAPVGRFGANPFGLFDMHGNVWEWCQDWFDESYYERAPAVDPPGPATGRFRAIRGGGWFNAAEQNRAAQRVYFDPTFRYCLLSGFRVVLEAGDQFDRAW